MEALFSKSFPQLKWFLKVVPPPCGVLTCTTEGPVAGLQVLHHHRLHVTAGRRPRSDVSERDFQPASDSLRPYCLFPTACANGSLWRIRPVIKKKQTSKKKNKQKNPETSCHDSKNGFVRTHSLAAHPQQWKLYFFLTPRGNVGMCCRLCQQLDALPKDISVQSSHSSRAEGSTVLRSLLLCQKSFWIKQARWLKFYLKHN